MIAVVARVISEVVSVCRHQGPGAPAGAHSPHGLDILQRTLVKV